VYSKPRTIRPRGPQREIQLVALLGGQHGHRMLTSPKLMEPVRIFCGIRFSLVQRSKKAARHDMADP
jgi:hypothetical protein